MREKDERRSKAEMNGPNLVCNEIIITIDEIARAADERKRRSSAASYSSGLVKRFEERSRQLLSGFVREVAAQYGENILDTEV